MYKKEITKKKKNRQTLVKKRIKNFNKVLSKTIIITREVDEISKCVKGTLPTNRPARLLVDMLVSMKKHSAILKKGLRSRSFVMNNIENIGNANLLKIFTLNKKKRK